LVVATPWQGSCFGPTFSKPCQYNSSDTNVYVGVHEVSLEATQFTLQKQITWRKKDVLIGKWHAVMQASPIKN
jgi:hypothetical protein